MTTFLPRSPLATCGDQRHIVGICLCYGWQLLLADLTSDQRHTERTVVARHHGAEVQR